MKIRMEEYDEHLTKHWLSSQFLIITLGDKLVGEVSRLVVAEACIQALDIEFTEGQIYEINSVKVFSFSFLKRQVQFFIGNYLHRSSTDE